LIPGAPRRGEPGTHEHRVSGLIAPRRVHGPRTARCARIRGWVRGQRFNIVLAIPNAVPMTPNPNAFTRSPLDRAGHHRRDTDWLKAALENETTRVVPFFRQRPFVIEENGAVVPGWLNPHALARIAHGDAPLLFLGLDAEGLAHFAVHIDDDAPLADLGRFEDLRALGPRLSGDDLAALGPAKAV